MKGSTYGACHFQLEIEFKEEGASQREKANYQGLPVVRRVMAAAEVDIMFSVGAAPMFQDIFKNVEGPQNNL